MAIGCTLIEDSKKFIYMCIVWLQEELGAWVIPQDYDHIEAEAAHLIFEADTNKVSMTVGVCCIRVFCYNYIMHVYFKYNCIVLEYFV